jgi:hypothetical protein
MAERRRPSPTEIDRSRLEVVVRARVEGRRAGLMKGTNGSGEVVAGLLACKCRLLRAFTPTLVRI